MAENFCSQYVLGWLCLKTPIVVFFLILVTSKNDVKNAKGVSYEFLEVFFNYS